MNCTINDLNLSFDKDNRLRSTIGRVSGWNVDKATMLAAQLQSDDFKKFLSKNLTDNDILTDATVDINNIQNSDYVNIKQNKFGSLLNYYYLTHYHSIDSTKTNKGMGRLLGFSSSNAKKVAKEYVGDLIIGRYQNELNKPREVRKTNGDIINEVRKELNDTFIKRADNFADNIIATDKYSQEAKDYAQRYKDTIKRGKTLAAEINRNNPWLSSTKSLIDEFEKKERNAAEEKQYQELKKNYEEIGKAQNQRREAIARIKQDRKIMAYNLMTLFISNEDAAVGVRNHNFANLVMQVNGNPNEFFFEVYNTKKMTNLIKEYNKTGDISEYIEDEDINNDDQDNQFNNQTIDETSKSWEDNLYKNFNTAVSTKMKFMLSRIPKLAAPFSSTSNAQAADTNNELGVPLYYDSGYLTLQIFANADFTNIDSMISSLERKSNQIKALYGLGSFINRLKQDRTLANYVYANFAKPIVNKVMTTINDVKVADGIVFDYSNPNAFGQVKLAFDMMNKLRATYNSQYNTKDSETLERLGRTKDEDINNIRKEFAKVLTTYFPNFDTTTLDNIFNLSNREEVVRSLIRNLKSIVDGVGKIKDNINAEYDRINKKYIDECNKYNDKVAELYKKKVPQHLYPEPPVKDEFDVSKYNLSGTVNQAIIRFANTISEYNESRARLNTANAEGNTASDVIKNCFITRFFDMILSENENDSNAGLKALRDYLLQGTENGKDNQYSNNPIFFGLKDQYGNPVAGAEGMFTKTPNGAVINPNAKSILKYALFDGVKNANSGIGTVYDKMSKIEFFITQYIAFNNSLEERTENGTTKNVGNLKTAVYPMRIGSDAPKIFMIRAPRYTRRQVEYALFDHFINEMTMLVQGINNLFTIKDGNFVTKTDVDGLIGRAYFNEKTANKIRNSGGTDYTKAIVEDGKLTGKMFKFYRLFQLNGYDFNKQLEDALSLYGPGREGKPALFAVTADGRIMLNNDYLKRPESFLVIDGDKVRLNLNNTQRDYFMDMVHTWATTYLNESKAEISDYLEALEEQGIQYDNASIDSFLLNTAVMNMNYDDLFEGDFKFYNNPRDFLKRTKETQAGGDAYENSNTLDWTNDITELEWNGQPATISVKQTRGGEAVPYVTPTYRNGAIDNNAPMVSRNGWRAVTIYNTIKPADEAQQLQEVLYKQFISEGMDEARAHARSVKIAKGYWDNTTANDAQSYITLEEFIRRKEADGTLDEYQDLLAQLLDPNVSANELDLDEINARIQVQKNFYFDKVFDADTGQFIPRQIKNAEFVLIPKLLPEGSPLIQVYNWMKRNDIGQLNTAETDKAAKKNIFTIWDEQTGQFDKDFESKFDIKYIQNYKYKYLYKQQDVPQHMVNEENKLGSQISKKIIDNVSTASKQVQDWADEYQAGYVANIREDFLNFLDSMGWELDASGKIVNSEYATVDVDGNPLNAETIRSNREILNLTNYYTRARQEAVRLGMDSNFIEYLIPDEFGKPVMPNAMNNVQQKLESVGQALFNRAITRQTLPGWHAAQITGIGYSRNLKFDAESGIMEVYLPRWSNLIPKGKTPEEDAAILKQIQEAGLDIHLGYRIPTEGKQSISVLRVVGFTNEALGSTIVVPDAWVTQTGSDFDVDSIYGICWEIYRKKEKDGTYTVHKVPYKEEETDDRMLYINHVNSRLDNKVKRTDLGEEIDSIVKKLKARIRGEQKEAKTKRENLSKLFDEQDDIRNEIYRKRLPAWARGIIKDENAAAKRKAKADGVVVDLTDAYPNIANKFTKYLNNHTLSEEEINAVQDYLDQQTTLLNIIDAQRGGYRFSKEDYFNEKNAAIQQAIEDNINAWVKNVETEAAKVGIMSFEEFKTLPYVERLNRRARNNYILERMINIMNDASSREEQYGRSQFESIVNGEDGANDIVDKIAGTTTKLISPYNPLTQLDYFDDAMGGAALKARSVNWDTMASKSNRAHGYLSDDNAVYAILNVDGESAPDSAATYDEETIKKAYGEDVNNYDEYNHLLNDNVTRTSNDVDSEGKTFIVKGVGDEIYDYHLYTGIQRNGNYTDGGDTIFSEVAEEFGIKTTGYGPKHMDVLTDEQRQEVEEAYQQAVKDLGRTAFPANTESGRLVRRDYLQAKAADAIFAIGNIVYPGQRNSKGYVVKAKGPSIDGGTGYAVQMAINMGKPVNVFVPTEKQWYRYDYAKQDFVKQFVPKLTPKFAGIGTRGVKGNEVVKEYIKQLFTVTRDGLYKKTNQVHDVFNTPTSKKQLLLKANKFGWSNNNKNVVNDYVTTSTAQTTAHHLDAVKRGSIPNVNSYTFDVYKLITCLGLDHEFSVGFMRQPIISRIVANYNLTNSIYFRDSNDPIDMTVADIAKDLNLQYVTETKFGTRANSINKHSNLNESVDALKKDENFVAAFKSIFGVDISNMSGNNIFALKIPLRKDYMFQRIRTAGKNGTNKININDATAYNEAAVDFATLIQFRQMLATTKKINTIIQFSAVDKIGAKPSNRETRQIRDSINRFRDDTVLMVGNKTWADALFPLDEDGNVDVNASVNPPIAASYAYSTLPSIQVAGQVFVTEQQDYIDAENNIQKIIGRRFTEQEAKEWRRYGMIYLYNGIGKLLEPLMVDKRGRIIPFISKTEENNTEPKTANLYWNDERSRIVGYGVTSESTFTVGDINNPTDAELAEYAKLTPAQKVIFIQRNFPDNQSIFNYIKVTLINNTDTKTKGITRQYLSYDDQVDSIEDLFHFFRNSFSNHNPLIKLVCVDLIKYAFIAEGFNFRSGYITKTVPNDTLYTDVNQGGMDIINNIDLAHPDNNGVVEKLRTLPAQLVSEEFIDLFIRSHSELIKTIRIPNAEYKTDRDTGEAVEKNSWSKMFKLCTRPDGLVLLDNTTQNPTLRGLINKLNLKNKVNGYVKVDFPIDQTHRDTRLYLVVAGNKFNILNDKKEIIGTDYKDYYLVPLNLLEKYETYDMSYNERYNKFNNFNYYLDICEKLETATESRRKAKSNAIVTEANRMVAGVKQQVGTYHPSTGGVQDAMKVITALTSMANSADEKLAAGARMLTNPISRIMIPRVLGDNYSAMYILNNNRIFAQYIPQGTSTTQVVLDADGNAQEFTIASIPANHTARKAVKEMIDDATKIDTKDRQDEYQYIVDQCKDTKTSPFGSIIYRVSPVKKTDTEVSDTIMKAATVTIDPVEDDTVDRADIVGNSARRGMNIDNVSAAIIKQITYDARKNDRDIAIDFVRNLERRGINRNFRSNLIEHRGDIYTAAARYYQSAANAIINRINKYNLLGEDYDMSEEAMYEVLAQNPEYFAEVANLILDAVTFGNRIDMIFSLDIAAEDKQTKDAVESIIRSINSIRTNTKVRMAMNNLINIYFKRYSTNPMITQGLMNIRDQFGDIDTAVKLIADPAEINNNEVQIILKQIYTMFSQAEMFETRRNVKEWKDAVDEINKMTGNLDMKNVIDFDNFKLRDDFNEDFYKDKTKVIDDYKEAKQHRFDSIDDYDKYLRAQYARDEFMYKYTEQPIISDYYKEDLDNRQRAMERGGKLYSEYRMLSAMLYEQKDILEDNEIETIKARIRELKSITDIVGAEKAPHLKIAAEAINDYIDKRRDITNKYFNKQEYDGFQETYQRYNSFIKSYDKHHSEETLDEKLENAEYREAYEWIKNNGHVAFTQEASDKLSDAFQKLVERKSAISTKTKIRLKAVEGAIDESGTINPMALSDEQIRLLKEEEETELSTKYTNGDGEMILIKDIPKGIPLRFRKKKAIKYKQDPDKARTIGRINEIISKAVNHDTGKIDIPTLFNNEYVTDAEREELARLYEHLYARGVGFEDDRGVSYSLEYNRDAYNAAMNYYNTNLRNTKQGKQFLKIVTHITADGQLLPNTYMYGYKLPFEEFVDQERTDAFNFIQDNVEFVPTEYYYQALKKASEEGRYDEWFELNHVYNPFSHKFEPLKIWTRSQAKPNSELAKSVEYIPSFDNMEQSVKKEYINNAENRRRVGLTGEGYKEFGSNYKRGNSKYDSAVKRNDKEQAMYDLISQTLNKYAATYQGKRFVGQGYLPRERETQVNGRWALGQIAAMFGASWHSGADSDSFHETVDYSHDREAEMKMLQLLKDKGSKKYKKLPNRADFKTDEDYQKELEKVREENRQIAEENRKIDKGLVNKDVLKVMEDFVYNATIFNSRQAAKPYLYLLLEDLAVNNAYMIKGMWNKRLVKDLDTSTRDDTQYRRVQQTNARELVHNLARRLIYSQYHDTGALRTVANFMQNLTSAKFMIFNLYGGVANVATGKVNIAMEEFANEYFGFKEMHKAERMYLSNSAAFVASMFTEKSPNLTVALCKQFKVVDFDQVLQFGATSDNLDARMRTVRNFMYSFQSMGEHYMQNSVALAMLESNRLYTDSEGNIRIGDFKDFTWDVESRAMHDVLAAYPDLLMGYKAYKESIAKYSIEQRLELSMGHKDLNRNFLYSLRDNIDENINALYKKIATAYQKRREELMKEAKQEFVANPTVHSLYEFKNGEAVLTAEAIAKLKGKAKDPERELETLIAGLREKIKAVNKKIHGVYDKNGAALIESKWWGSLVMQYHKHLPMGIWKRWRRKGYYSEFRGSMERGTYQTFLDFIGTEFTNFKTRRSQLQENGTGIALASIQVAMESLLNSFVNIQFNWNNLSNWERANIRRNIAEITGVLTACLVVFALYGLSDDDDINDDRFKASLLYLADRLYSETTTYSPVGIISEYRTNLRNPIAAMQSVTDLMKAAVMIPQYLFDPSFEVEYQNGRYAGENKFEVLLKRNTAGFRNFDRIMTIDKNNSYYKVGKSQIGINVAKSFGDIVAGRDND